MSQNTVTLLLLQDNEIDRVAFERLVEREHLPYVYQIVQSVTEARKALAARRFDVVLCNCSLGDGTACDLLDQVADAAFIVITEGGSDPLTVRAMEKGADCLLKDREGQYLSMLPVRVEKAIAHKRIGRELAQVREQIAEMVEEQTAGLIQTNEKLVDEITRRAQLEEALHRERDLVARIAETSPAGITVVDRQGQITFANPRAEQILGLEKTEITQRSYNAPGWHITDYDGNPFPDEQLPFRQVMSTARPVFDVHHAIEWPDGRRVLLAISAAPLIGETGQLEGMVATVADVTAQVQAEAALRDSEAKYRNIIESVPIGMHIYQLEPDGRLVFIGANPAADDILGVDNRQYIGQSIEEAFPALTETEVPEVYRRVALTGESWQTDQITYQENEIAGAFAVHAFQTSPGRMVASFLDITARKRTEMALRESEERYRTLVESSSDQIFMLDSDGVYIASNDCVSRFGFASGQALVGRHLRDVFPPEVSESYLQRLEQVLATGEGTVFEYGMSALGSERVQMDTLYPIWRQDIVWAVGGISRDITERRRAEEALLQASRLEATATLAGGIAHDFNNLMVGVLGYADLLRDNLQDRPGSLEMLDVITESARRAGKLAQQMLAFARGGKYQPREMDLNDTVHRIASARERNLPSRIRVVLATDPELWQIKADPTQISEVVFNLFTNAVEAIEDSGSITITTHNCTLKAGQVDDLKPGSYVCLSVQDTGCGMSAEAQARIFEPFFTTKFQGRGMGLSAVYGIVDNHGGHIAVQSEKGQGATFEVYLPAHRTKVGKRSERQAVDAPQRDVLVAGAKTVLLIEDDAFVLKLLKRIMDRLKYSVLVAHNGQEAVDIARTHKGDIHLALLDMGMPEMGGAEAFPFLVKARPEMAVIICSGYEKDETAQSLLDAGAVAFIPKPFQISVLEAEINRAIEH